MTNDSRNASAHRHTAALTSVEHAGLDVRQVLGEALVLLLDLEGQLSGVAEHHHVHLAGHGLQQVQGGQHEHGGLAHAGLGLADDVGAQHGGRDALVLHCGADSGRRKGRAAVGHRGHSSNGDGGDRTENNVKKTEREQVGVSGLVRLHRGRESLAGSTGERQRRIHTNNVLLCPQNECSPL
jgi:hypothetical protein